MLLTASLRAKPAFLYPGGKKAIFLATPRGAGLMDELAAAAAVEAMSVDDATKEWEELLASLLGILFEAKLCQPAIHAFIEQNWLEGWERPAAAEQFAFTIKELRARRLISEIGVPIVP